ncbi:MAG: hypothetical protein RLZZ519_2400 [Bacteroidota bacterium]|jgi:hypothetical protein
MAATEALFCLQVDVNQFQKRGLVRIGHDLADTKKYFGQYFALWQSGSHM